MITTPNPTPTRRPLIEWIAGNRERASYALIGLGTLMMIVMIFLALRWDRNANQPAEPDQDKSKNLPELLEKGDSKDSKASLPVNKNPDYLWAAVWAAAVGVSLVGLGLWNINRQPQGEQEPFMGRILILAAGGTVGILTALLGLKFGYHWEEDLTRWINQGESKGARWVLAALAILVAGLMIAFISLQQARTEIRNNPTIRRLVYGYDFGLTGLLLLIVLVAVNLLASARLPATLDATEGGFYSLDPKSEQLLKDVNQPIHAYFIAHSNLLGAVTTDVRALFRSCEKANPKFKWTYLVPSMNGEEIAKLYDRLKISETDQTTGLILTVGENEEHSSFIRLKDLVKIKPVEKPTDRPSEPEAEQTPQLVFEGEPKIMNELQYLAEGKVKPIIYFTQGAGEVVLRPTREARNTNSAAELAGSLTTRNFDVRPLVLGEDKDRRWMKDATALVVFGPTRPFTEAEVKLVRDYMKPADGGKGGKLFALLPPMADKLVSRDRIAQTGLEPLLAEFGVDVPTEQIYVKPRQIALGGQQGTLYALGISGDPEFLASRHPLAGIVQNHSLYLLGVRPVQPMPVPGKRVDKLLDTNDQDPVWFEKTMMTSHPSLLWKAIDSDPALAREKRLGKQNVPVAVLVSEGQDPGVPRAAVFGMSDFVTNQGLETPLSEPIFSLDLFAGTLDWLRERPSNIGISPRVHNVFRLSRNFDEGRLLLMPLGVIVLTILGMGMGVWLMRRSP